MELAFIILSVCACIGSVVLFFADRKRYYLFTLVMILFLPKVNLLTVPGSSTGIRSDDFLLLIFLLLHLTAIYALIKNNKVIRIMVLLISAIVAAGFLSTAIGILIGTVNKTFISILASVRKVEYFVAFFLGLYTFKGIERERLKRWISCISVFLLAVCVLQKFKLFGAFISGNYTERIGYPPAVFNGPYEYAAMCCILIAVLLSLLLQAEKFSIKRDWLYLITFAILFYQLFETQSRTGLAVGVVIVFLELLFYGRKKKITYVIIGAGIVAVVGIFIFVPSLVSRFFYIDVDSMGRTFIERVYFSEYRAALDKLPSEGMFPKYTGDLSFFVRMSRWGAAINGFFENPVLGYGPGQLSTIDGSYVKLLCEGGIVSFGLFFALLITVAWQAKKTKRHEVIWCLIAILGFAIFIDVFDASKIMEAFWAFAAIGVADKIELPEITVFKKQKDIL